ncbi:hypothetical protein HWV62_40501 [Athelia sp. TMB]|nr:hypothetical protein HWV62_40501 [Athelia sp. TMB]
MVHIGRHFGRTVSAVVNMKTLIPDGIARQLGLHEKEFTLDDLDLEERRAHDVFCKLIAAIPDLYQRWSESKEAGASLCDMLQKGINNARSEDTKGLKGAMIDWLTMPGQPIQPPLLRHVKHDRGFNHYLTGKLLCPVNWDWSDPSVVEGLRSGATKILGVHWPLFLYENHVFDREEPWKGLFRGPLLLKAFKHIFTSPSSANDDEPRSTRSGNARIHGMVKASLPAIAYVATQVPIPTDTPLALIRAKRDAQEAAAANSSQASAAPSAGGPPEAAAANLGQAASPSAGGSPEAATADSGQAANSGQAPAPPSASS